MRLSILLLYVSMGCTILNASPLDTDLDGLSDTFELSLVPSQDPNLADDVLGDPDANGFSAWAEKLFTQSGGTGAPVSGRNVWTFPALDNITTFPVLGEEGTIYITSRDRTLYAINPDGSQRWSFTTDGYANHAPAIGQDGTVYLVTDSNKIEAIAGDGLSTIWTATVEGEIASSPVLGLDGTIYITILDRRIIALSPTDGSDLGAGTPFFDAGTQYLHHSPAIDADGSLYVVTDEKLYRLTSGGEETSLHNFSAKIAGSPVISAIGTVYISLRDRTVHAVHPDPASNLFVIDNTFTTTGYLSSSPSIDPHGNLYIGDEQGTLYALDPTLTQRWTFQVNDQINSSSIVAKDGVVYVSSKTRTLYSLHDDGAQIVTQRWTTETEGYIKSTSAVTKNGIVYVADANKLYAFIDDVIGRAPWSMQKHNITGNNHQCWASDAFVPSIDVDGDGMNDCEQFLMSDMPSPPTGPPGGSFNVPNPLCYIPAGQSDCDITIIWLATNVVEAQLWQNTALNNLQLVNNAHDPGSNTSGSKDVFWVTDQGIDFQILEGPTSTGSLLSQITVTGASGTISAIPTQCEIPSGANACTTSVTWSTKNLTSASLWRSDDGGVSWQSAQLGTSGVLLVSTTEQGTQLEVHPDATRSTALATSFVRGIKPPLGTVSANPSTCVIASGATTCSSTVTWSAANVSTASLWQYDGTTWTSLAQGLGSSVIVNSITASGLTFVVYDSANQTNALASAVVKGASASIATNPGQCDILQGESSCDSTVTWGTSNVSSASLWRSDGGGAWSSISSGTGAMLLVSGVTEQGVALEVHDGATRGTLLAAASLTATLPPDLDGDGVLNAADNCPAIANATQDDLDIDGLGDVCDSDRDGDNWGNDNEIACGSDPDNLASVPADTDADGICDALETNDDDLDGVPNTLDAFPTDPTESVDTDGDGIGNNADMDDDTHFITGVGDGVPDNADFYPLDAALHSDGVTSLRAGTTTASTSQLVDAFGGIVYSSGVDDDGLANITIPLQLLPGVNGLTPTLAIIYSSGRMADRAENYRTQGVLGYGWALEGISSIRRCEQAFGGAPALSLTTSDRLCLDGELLVAISGNYWAASTEYRTYRDTFAQIKAVTGGFEVKTSNGRILTYGVTADSHITAGGTGTDYVWTLSKMEDRFGNAVTYSYHTDAATGEYYPKEIAYSGAKINFDYAAREAKATTRIEIGPGFAKSSVYLHNVHVSMNGIKVREYALGSDLSVNNRRQLSWMQACGYDELGIGQECLDSIDFTWIETATSLDVSSLSDTLDAVTSFTYVKSLPLVTDVPDFRELAANACTQSNYLNGDTFNYSRRRYVTQLIREDGLAAGADNTWTYFAEAKPLFTLDNRGYSGHEIVAVRDTKRGTSIYTKRHTCFPFTGASAATYEYAGIASTSGLLMQVENNWTQTSLNNDVTEFVYPEKSIALNYENNVIFGALETTTLYKYTTFDVPLKITRHERTAQSATLANNVWLLNNTGKDLVTTIEFQEDQANWLSGFIQKVTTTHDLIGVPGSASKTQDVTFTRYLQTMKPAIITADRGSAAELVTTLGYDVSGNTTSVTQDSTDIMARTTTLSNFSNQRYAQTITNALSQSQSQTFDLRFGTPGVSTAIDGRISEVKRGPFGRVTELSDPTTRMVTISYNVAPGILNGHNSAYKAKIIDNAAPDASLTFDNLGRLINRQKAAFQVNQWIQENVEYDHRGRMVRQSLPFISGVEKSNTFTYDIQDRLLNQLNADGGSIAFGYSLQGGNLKVVQTQTITVPGSVNMTEASTRLFNPLGQLQQSVDADLVPTDYAYDAIGHLIGTTVNGDVTTATSMLFDHAGSRLSITEPNTGTTSFVRDALGQLKQQTDAANQITTFDYDLLGNLMQRIDHVGTGQNVNSWNYGTIGIDTGKLTNESNNGGNFNRTYTYDPGIGAPANIATTTNTQAGISTLNTVVTYDSLGRTGSVTYPGGYNVTYNYNSQGYLDHIREGTTGPVLQQVTAMDAFNHVTAQQFANGLVTSKGYDADSGRLLSIATGIGGAIQNHAYSWRSDGLLAQRQQGALAETFGYDSLKRLISASTASTSRTLSFAYDPLGNLTTKTSGVATDIDVSGYQYNATGNAGPHGVTSVTIGGVAHNLSYDLVGNVTLIDANEGDDRSFEYDSRNLATKITVGDPLNPTAQEEFSYDPRGRRYFKKSTWDDAGVPQTRYTLYEGAYEKIIDPVAMLTMDKIQISDTVQRKQEGVKPAEMLYLHRDHLGSVDKITDSAGVVVEDFAFDPFGGRRMEDWTVGISSYDAMTMMGADGDTSPGFTSHEQLDRTGIIHMSGRIYDPTIGRFLNADPFVQAPGFSQSHNRYSYVLNSPLSFRDPSGFENSDVNFSSPRVQWGELLGEHLNDIAPNSAQTIGQAAASQNILGGTEFRTVIGGDHTSGVNNTARAWAGAAAVSNALRVSQQNQQAYEQYLAQQDAQQGGSIFKLDGSIQSLDTDTFPGFFANRVLQGQVKEDLNKTFSALSLSAGAASLPALATGNIPVYAGLQTVSLIAAGGVVVTDFQPTNLAGFTLDGVAAGVIRTLGVLGTPFGRFTAVTFESGSVATSYIFFEASKNDTGF